MSILLTPYGTPVSSGGGGVSDHGLLTGLSDDDHSQYHNDTRGDARYYTQAQVAAGFAPIAKGVTNGDSHDHVGGDGAQIDHGGLAGLDDDDHGQYKLANGLRFALDETTVAAAWFLLGELGQGGTLRAVVAGSTGSVVLPSTTHVLASEANSFDILYLYYWYEIAYIFLPYYKKTATHTYDVYLYSPQYPIAAAVEILGSHNFTVNPTLGTPVAAPASPTAANGVMQIGPGIASDSGALITEFSTDGTMAGNSDNAVPTERAVVTYGSNFAPASEGVTNGDSHDHDGGDGAQIDHTTLANKGTNTHAQIDTHLGSTSNPHSVSKTDVSLGNVTNDAQIAKSIGTTKGDIIGFTASATPSRLAVGTDDYVLTADAAEATGMRWAAVGGAVGNILRVTHTAQQDISSTSTASPLALSWNTEIDKDSGFTHSTVTNSSRLTVDSAGTYRLEVNAEAYNDSSNSRELISIGYSINGSATLEKAGNGCYFRGTNYSDNEAWLSFSDTFKLSASDYVEIEAWIQSGPGNSYIQADNVSAVLTRVK
jgi:hypothetical protein